jgi:hypothetical protein
VHVFTLIVTVQAFCPGVLPKSEAKDLTDALEQGFSFAEADSFIARGVGEEASMVIGTQLSGAIAAAIASAVTQEFPLASAAPAFTYRFNPALEAFERLTNIPGPLFSERAPTLGKGQLNFGVGYSFIDFSNLNGTDLDNVRSPLIVSELFFREGVPQGQLPTGEELVFAPFSGSLIDTRIDLKAHVIVPTLRYGITHKWDVSLSVPIVHTFVSVRNKAVRVVDVDFSRAGFLFTVDAQGTPTTGIGFFDPEGNPITSLEAPLIKSQRPTKLLSRAAGSATGVGDITLRSKYHFWQSESGGAALGLNLQLPSGEVRDFHGTEETHLSTFLYLSQVLWQRFEPHLNLGVDFNADDVDRSNFRYAAGTTLLVGKDLGLVVDFLRRSEFGRFPVRVPPEALAAGFSLENDRAPDTCTTAQPCFVDVNKVKFFPVFPERIKRNDIANFTFGLRYALGTRGSIFFGGVVPFNDEGFRADFIPAGGIEYTF